MAEFWFVTFSCIKKVKQAKKKGNKTTYTLKYSIIGEDIKRYQALKLFKLRETESWSEDQNISFN